MLLPSASSNSEVSFFSYCMRRAESLVSILDMCNLETVLILQIVARFVVIPMALGFGKVDVPLMLKISA